MLQLAVKFKELPDAAMLEAKICVKVDSCGGGGVAVEINWAIVKPLMVETPVRDATFPA